MGEAEKQQRPLAGQPVRAECGAVLVGQRERRYAARLRQHQQGLQLRLLAHLEHPEQGVAAHSADDRHQGGQRDGNQALSIVLHVAHIQPIGTP